MSRFRNEMWNKYEPQHIGWRLIEKLYDNYLDDNNISNYENKIPKKIHQIWVGGKCPEKYLKCCETIQKCNPDYEYKLWTDKDVNNFYLKNRKLYDAVSNKGAKSDILRYEILLRYGGIYIDTDFIGIKSLDHFLKFDLFAGTAYVKRPEVLNGLIGCISNHPLMQLLVDQMLKIDINHAKRTKDIINLTGPYFLTRGFLNIIKPTDNVVIFPEKYFYSFPSALRHNYNKKLAEKYIKEDSYVTHLWGCSWQ